MARTNGRPPTRKSKSGTRSRAANPLPGKKGFSSADVCRIIEQCKRSGVTEIDVEGVHLKFAPTKETEAAAQGVDPPLKSPAIDHDKQSKEFLESEELQLKEERIANMILEDPAEFERQIASGELDEELIEDDRGFMEEDEIHGS